MSLLVEREAFDQQVEVFHSEYHLSPFSVFGILQQHTTLVFAS
jgi:hypothetical protein